MGFPGWFKSGLDGFQWRFSLLCKMEKERIGQRLFKRWVVWAPVPRVSVTSETWFLAPIKLVPVCYNTVNYPELSDATVGTHLLTRAS